ncbi:MAG: DUF4469 domain-containing protein [Spirochaetaceae bacterium]|nr:DUF4469 domain-containing protein [Spirochaetaceae bacterium]
MNTNMINTLRGKVNVTIHKNYLKEDNSTYAKVQRTTAGMHNVIAAILNKTKVFDKASLVAVEMLFKDAILDLLSQGLSVNLFELGTLYPCAQGNIASDNPNISDIPNLSLNFTPSQEALAAVEKADISMAKLEEFAPQISIIEDLSTHLTNFTVTAGKPIRITGRRLKIAGEDEKTGLFLAPHNTEGKFDETESDWIRLDNNSFFKNTLTYLEVILPDTLETGKRYTLVIKTSAGRGKTVNKTVRELVYDKPLTVN